MDPQAAHGGALHKRTRLTELDCSIELSDRAVTAAHGPSVQQETDNPDLRDRAFIYWRLLSTDPEAARTVVLSEKPVIGDTAAALEPALLSTLLANLSTLASVYHKPPEVRPQLPERIVLKTRCLLQGRSPLPTPLPTFTVCTAGQPGYSGVHVCQRDRTACGLLHM